MLISQRIDNLLNGVSQLPQELRHSSQAQQQTNALSSPYRGLMKRPPMVHLGLLDATPVGWGDAFVHTISMDEAERYHVVIADGEVFVYDALTQTAETVISPSGTAYLDDPGGKGFRATTVGDTTYIVNRGKVVTSGTTKSEAGVTGALLYVRQADYATKYSVTINGFTLDLTTEAATDPSARIAINTDEVALALAALLTTQLLYAGFNVRRFGSTLHIYRNDGQDFTISVSDGLADKGLHAIKGTVQSFSDLPRRAPNGFVVEVAGDPESELDNYWVKFKDIGGPQREGVWLECAKPGIVGDLDASTMPHRLVRLGRLVEDVEHQAPTDLPVAGMTGVENQTETAVYIPWQNALPGGGALTAVYWFAAHGTPWGLNQTEENASGFRITLNQSGQAFEIPNFWVLVSEMDLNTAVTVTIYKNGTAKDARTFHAAPDAQHRMTATGSFRIEEPFVSGDIIEVKLTYSGGATPPQYHRSQLTVVEATLLGVVRRELQFDLSFQLVENTTAPIGTKIDVTVDSVLFTRTLTVPETPAQIASAFATLIDAHASFVASIGSTPETVNITTTAGTPPSIQVAVTFDNAKIFHNPDLNMVVNEHVGRIMRNLSDRSSGVIQSNTAKTVTVDALSGGTDNVFSSGDLVRIEGSTQWFVFEPCPWKERQAGDLKVVPFPSFLDKTIADVGFYSNRLAFVSGENLVLSSSGDPYNLFRYSAAQLLDDDVIDVKSAHRDLAIFHSLVLWNEALYAISETAQYLVSGEPVLSPKTIRLDPVSHEPNTSAVRPLVCGNRMYLARYKGGFTQLREFFVPREGSIAVESADITAAVPKYLKGRPITIVGDDDLGCIVVLTNADGQEKLYVYSYQLDAEKNTRSQYSWSEWKIASGLVVGLDMVDGNLGVLVLESDGGYLNSINMNVALDTVTSDEGAQYLDRRIIGTEAPAAVYDSNNNWTTWTLPYAVAVNGSEGTIAVVRRSPSVVNYAVTRPDATHVRVAGQGDLTVTSVYIGVLYEFRYKLSRLYYRNRDGQAETRGRLALRYLDVHYRDTTAVAAVVTAEGRAAITYSVANALADEGILRFPIQTRNEFATIEFVNGGPGVCSLSSLEWEGDLTVRSKRV
jgi:hypothetical protein